jgi:hypothetical protein
MASRTLNQGQTIPLRALVGTGSTTKVVKADLYDASNSLVAGPITMTGIGEGYYSNDSQTMPSTSFIKAIYSCYEIDGATPAVDCAFKTDDTFILGSPLATGGFALKMSVSSNQTSIAIPTPSIMAVSVQSPKLVTGVQPSGGLSQSMAVSQNVVTIGIAIPDPIKISVQVPNVTL